MNEDAKTVREWFFEQQRMATRVVLLLRRRTGAGPQRRRLQRAEGMLKLRRQRVVAAVPKPMRRTPKLHREPVPPGTRARAAPPASPERRPRTTRRATADGTTPIYRRRPSSPTRCGKAVAQRRPGVARSSPSTTAPGWGARTHRAPFAAPLGHRRQAARPSESAP